MTQVYIGQIIQGGWNFAPRGFHLCDGTMMPVSQNSALYSLLGTAFGGNGSTTFGLPDLRGRAMVGTGTGPGLSTYIMGQQAGTQTTQILAANLPPHTHPATFVPNPISATVLAADAPSTDSQAQSTGSILARASGGITVFAPASTTPTVPLGGVNVSGGGGGVSVGPNSTAGTGISVVQPVLGVTCVIALQGIYPSRN